MLTVCTGDRDDNMREGVDVLQIAFRGGGVLWTGGRGGGNGLWIVEAYFARAFVYRFSEKKVWRCNLKVAFPACI